MRLGLGWAVLALALTVAPAARACLPDAGWPDTAEVNQGEAAALLVQSASFIDLAEVEKLRPDPVQTARGRAWLEGDAVLFHLRVIRRLKGNPAVVVRDLSGIDRAGELPPESSSGSSREASLSALRFALGRRELSQTIITNCYGWDAIAAAPGMKVLVFRDARGGLLNLRIPIRFKGRYLGVWGPSFTPVTGMDDPWVKLVDKEITDHGPRFVDPSKRSPLRPPPPPGY